MTWHAHAQWIACALEMRSSNKRERPFKFINLCNGMQWIEVVFHLTILWTLSNEISNVGVIWNYSHQCRTFQNWSCHATISNISNGQHVNKHVIAVKPYHSAMFLKKKGIKKRFAIIWSTWQSKLIRALCDVKGRQIFVVFQANVIQTFFFYDTTAKLCGLFRDRSFIRGEGFSK